MKHMDREKVIKGLEQCLEDSENPCSECPYEITDTERSTKCIDKVMADALVLLKEQETTNTGNARIFKCEKCGYGFDDIFLCDEHNYEIEPKFCPNCGRSVKWE